jgi:hypothetical protein
MKKNLWRSSLVGIAMMWFVNTSVGQVYISHSINQAPALIASAGPDRSICNAGTLQIGGTPSASGGTAGYVYNWQPPTGLSSASDPNPTATISGTQAYTLTVSDANGCSSTIAASAVTAAFSFTANLLNVGFTNTSVGGTSNFWDFGNGATSTFANPAHTYAAPGTYNVCLSIFNSTTLCADTICTLVTVVAVGIDPQRQGQLIVYPNPSVDSDLNFSLRGISLVENVQINLYDAAGRLVRQYQGPATQEIHTIRRHGLASGNYSYQFLSGEALISEGKIILE